MNPYKKPYTLLFNGITDALAALAKGEPEQAVQLLILAQRNAEECFLESDGTF